MMERRQITGPVAAFSERLALGQLCVPAVDLGTIVAGSWHGADLRAARGSSMHFDADDAIRLQLDGFQCPVSLHDGAAWHAGLEFTTTTGHIRCEALQGVESRPGAYAIARLCDWTWKTGCTPVAWVGRLGGSEIRSGNLETGAGTPWRGDGLLLAGGGLRWQLWPARSAPAGSDASSVFVLDASAGDVDHGRILRQLGLLEFVLGSQLRLGQIIGVDEDGRAVAALGIGYDRTHRMARQRCPVPHWRGLGWCREALFQAVADHVEAAGDADFTYLLRQSYVESLGGNIDVMYLACQVALEAFAKSARKPQANEDLAPKKAWARWCKEQEPAVRSLAVDGSAADKLVGKLFQARKRPTTMAVIDFFEEHDRALPMEIVDELRLRNDVAHGLVMSQGVDRNLYEDSRRLEVIQMVMVAALALHVGYRGPITDQIHITGVADWWEPAGDEDRTDRHVLSSRADARRETSQ